MKPRGYFTISIVMALMLIAAALFGAQFWGPSAASAQSPTTPTVAPTVAPVLATTTLDVAIMQQWIAQTANDAEADNFVNMVGAYCDTNPTSCTWSQLGNWPVNGPSVLLTDPIGVSMTSNGWQVVKTFQMNDTYWGAYYCASSCISPKPGRAVMLSAALTLTPVTAPTVAPTVVTAVANSLSVAQMEAYINQVASDQYADSLSLLVGGFCDTNVTACVASQYGNWTVTGPAVILTDPGHLALQGGVSIIKTWQLRTDWIFGVYYCPESATCTIPTPGRAAFLDAALPASLLH